MAESTVLPTWFRRTLIIVATLLMCSCSARGQECLSCPVEGCPAESCPVEGGCVVDGCPVCKPQCFAGPGDEYLCDGGDQLFSAGVLQDGSMVGLEQEDTVATYQSPEGETFVVPSTRTCIYAPRFASVRRVIHPIGAQQRLFVDQLGDQFSAAEADLKQTTSVRLQNTELLAQALPLPPGLYRSRQQLGETIRLLAAAELKSLLPVYANLQIMQAGVIEMAEGPIIAQLNLAAITWTGDQELQIAYGGQAASALFSPKQPGLLYQTEEGAPRLRLVKCASTDTAVPGDEVEFTLRYDNLGDAPLTKLVIVDNLTTRLEYVEDSAQSTRDAEFSTSRNNAGSLILRWELTQPLEPGEGGVLTFKCRVR